MGTNLEGRLIALEIERKRLSERLDRALADIAGLKQFRRTAPGLGWNWGGASQTGYYCYADAVIVGADSVGTGKVYQGPTGTLAADPATLVNLLGTPVLPGSRCPVAPHGTEWMVNMPPPAIGVADLVLGGGGAPGSGPVSSPGVTVHAFSSGAFYAIPNQYVYNITNTGVTGWNICVAAYAEVWVILPR